MVLATLGLWCRQKRWMYCALIACIFDLLPVALASTTIAATTAATTTTTQTVTLTVTVTVTETQTQTQESVIAPNFDDLQNPESAGSGDQTAPLQSDPTPANNPTQCYAYDNTNACAAAPQGYVATCTTVANDGTTCTSYQCCPATPQCSQLIVPVGQNTQCCPIEAPATAMNDGSTQCCQQGNTPTTCPGGLTLTVMSDGTTQINTCCQATATVQQSNSGAGVVNNGADVANSGAGVVNSGADVINSNADAGGHSGAGSSSSTGTSSNTGANSNTVSSASNSITVSGTSSANSHSGRDQQIAEPLGRLPLSGVQPTPAPSPTPEHAEPNPEHAEHAEHAVDDIPIEHVLGVLGGALFIIMLPAAYVMIQGKNKPGGKSGATSSAKGSAEATEAEASLETPLKDN